MNAEDLKEFYNSPTGGILLALLITLILILFTLGLLTWASEHLP